MAFITNANKKALNGLLFFFFLFEEENAAEKNKWAMNIEVKATASTNDSLSMRNHIENIIVGSHSNANKQ